MKFLIAFLIFLCSLTSYSQNSLTNDNINENLELYNKLCPILGGDSVRYCNGLKCTGPVKDYYPDGKLKHKGYYDQGKIVSVFTNYYHDGNIERSFVAKSEIRGIIQIFYPDSILKSKGEYFKGEVLKWEDFYENGKTEFLEEYDKSIDYHLYTRFYYEDGSPQILFELIDKKNRSYTYKEFFSNGQIEEQGNKIQNKSTKDYLQDGIWKYYNESGKLLLEEEYIKGMLNNEVKFQ